jgi:hypothetical protein
MESMARINSPILGGSQMGVVVAPLTMEQQMLLRTLREINRPMSAHELTNHWMPTWSLLEVNKYLHDLVQSGHVQFHGREAKLYSLTTAQSNEKGSSK